MTNSLESKQETKQRLKKINREIAEQLGEMGIFAYHNIITVHLDETKKKFFKANKVNLDQLESYFKQGTDPDFERALKDLLFYYRLMEFYLAPNQPEYQLFYSEEQNEAEFEYDYLSFFYERNVEKWLNALLERIPETKYGKEIKKIKFTQRFSQEKAAKQMENLIEAIQKDSEKSIKFVGEKLFPIIREIIATVQAKYPPLK